MEYNKGRDFEFATKDLYLSAFLSVKGVTILGVEQYGSEATSQGMTNKKTGAPAYFIFENRDRCEELESVFWSGTDPEATVNVKEYTTALRDLRTRAFSVSRMVSTVEKKYAYR